MAHSKSLGVGAMVVLLLLAVTLLPMIVRYVNRMEPYYVDGMIDGQLQGFINCGPLAKECGPTGFKDYKAVSEGWNPNNPGGFGFKDCNGCNEGFSVVADTSAPAAPAPPPAPLPMPSPYGPGSAQWGPGPGFQDYNKKNSCSTSQSCGFRDYMSPMNLVDDSTDQGVVNVPAIGRTSQLPSWRPDLNTNYLCRSPNESGVPCPEGQFCDGTTQGCVPVAMFGDPNKNYVGYYA